jgi:energy-coupling factor transporter ATP-binding protein EcfA2
LAPDKVGAAVEEMIREVGLTEKRHVASKNLSGGEHKQRDTHTHLKDVVAE